MSADLKHGLQPNGWFKDRNRDRLLIAWGRTCATQGQDIDRAVIGQVGDDSFDARLRQLSERAIGLGAQIYFDIEVAGGCRRIISHPNIRT